MTTKPNFMPEGILYANINHRFAYLITPQNQLMAYPRTDDGKCFHWERCHLPLLTENDIEKLMLIPAFAEAAKTHDWPLNKVDQEAQDLYLKGLDSALKEEVVYPSPEILAHTESDTILIHPLTTGIYYDCNGKYLYFYYYDDKHNDDQPWNQANTVDWVCVEETTKEIHDLLASFDISHDAFVFSDS